MKPAGWCTKHFTLVYPTKFREYCRTRMAGKRCKFFDYKIPDWKAGDAASIGKRMDKAKRKFRR